MFFTRVSRSSILFILSKLASGQPAEHTTPPPLRIRGLLSRARFGKDEVSDRSECHLQDNADASLTVNKAINRRSMPLARMLSRKSKDTNSISIQTVPQPALLLGALLPLFLSVGVTPFLWTTRSSIMYVGRCQEKYLVNLDDFLRFEKKKRRKNPSSQMV